MHLHSSAPKNQDGGLNIFITQVVIIVYFQRNGAYMISNSPRHYICLHALNIFLSSLKIIGYECICSPYLSYAHIFQMHVKCYNINRAIYKKDHTKEGTKRASLHLMYQHITFISKCPENIQQFYVCGVQWCDYNIYIPLVITYT